MTNRGVDIKNPKQRGEWAEMCFMARAAAHGLCVTKPYGDSAHYDFAIEHQGHFLRVQVKSTKRTARKTLLLQCAHQLQTVQTEPNRLCGSVCDPSGPLVHHSGARVLRPMVHPSLARFEDLEIRSVPGGLASSARPTVKVPRRFAQRISRFQPPRFLRGRKGGPARRERAAGNLRPAEPPHSSQKAA